MQHHLERCLYTTDGQAGVCPQFTNILSSAKVKAIPGNASLSAFDFGILWHSTY
jgi:hypothetical protein